MTPTPSSEQDYTGDQDKNGDEDEEESPRFVGILIVEDLPRMSV